jgi:DNA topoisomerase-1
MTAFGEPALKQSIEVIITINGHCFFLRGTQILKEGWMQFYKPHLRTEEVLLPQLKGGDLVKFTQVKREYKFTNPPPRYNPSSLLKRMEEEGIGTKATRADIIDRLYNRHYIAEERINVTELGFNIITILAEYCPTIISVELTRDLEERMEKIQTQNEQRENVLAKTVTILKTTIETFKEKELEIGKTLNETIKKTQLQERIIGNCPNCRNGKLMIIYSRKTKKRFIGCTNYFQNICRTSFPLPQKGTVKPTGRNCNTCGWPMLQIYVQEKRSWSLCFNPHCPLVKGGNKRREMQNLRKRSNN